MNQLGSCRQVGAERVKMWIVLRSCRQVGTKHITKLLLTAYSMVCREHAQVDQLTCNKAGQGHAWWGQQVNCSRSGGLEKSV